MVQNALPKAISLPRVGKEEEEEKNLFKLRGFKKKLSRMRAMEI